MLVVLITPPPVDEAGRKEYAQYVSSHIKYNRLHFFSALLELDLWIHKETDLIPLKVGIDLRSLIQLF